MHEPRIDPKLLQDYRVAMVDYLNTAQRAFGWEPVWLEAPHQRAGRFTMFVRKSTYNRLLLSYKMAVKNRLDFSAANRALRDRAAEPRFNSVKLFDEGLPATIRDATSERELLPGDRVWVWGELFDQEGWNKALQQVPPYLKDPFGEKARLYLAFIVTCECDKTYVVPARDVRLDAEDCDEGGGHEDQG